MDMSLKVMPAEEVFYYQHEDGKLIEAVLTHVDGLIVAGNAVFNEMIRKKNCYSDDSFKD